MKQTVWISIVILFIVFFYILLKFIKTGIVETDNRVQNALSVFDDPAYDTMRESIPTTYYNPYYKKNMGLNICDFYWASSRKSYLPAGQSYDLTSYVTIQKVLRAGARIINLDIYANTDDKWDIKAIPVVRANTKMPLKGSSLDFKKCLEIIRDNAWIDNKDYPLILYLEIHFNESTTDSNNPYMDKNVFLSLKIAQGLYDTMKTRLLDKKYGFNCRNNLYPFGQIPIEDCLGKVIIVTNVFPTHGVLDELINSSAAPNQQVLSIIEYDSNYQQYGGISGKHIETTDLIDHNKQNLTLVNNPGTLSFENIYDPKSDLYNPPISDTNEFGCQFTLMNYQLFDDNMKTYLTFFKNSSFVLKPDKLRYIPKPPPPLKKQDKPNEYAMRNVKTTGWYSLNY